tara:strand:- start:596 stop:1132 length:537 start_codon:yes stop_codon:yes gene_type:complete
MNVFEKLSIPFPPSKIHWRIGRKSKKKDKATALAYVDARDIMDRLDSVLGAARWKDDYTAEPPRKVRKLCNKTNAYYYEEICGRVKCSLSVRDDAGEWITKCDAAGETNVEGEKGGYSDALKRAAVKFGIGRDLYRIKSFYYPIDDFGNFTQTPNLPPEYLDKLTKMKEQLKEEKKNG